MKINISFLKSSLKVILFLMLFYVSGVSAQWTNPLQLADLNIWSSQSGFIGWYGGIPHTPDGGSYGSGIQISLPQDSRFGAQIVIPTFNNQIFYRRNQAGVWDSWITVWSSSNLNKPDVSFNCQNLYANGNLWAKQVQVASVNPWPDYVFEKKYYLMPLGDLEKYIEENKHLPDMPSAGEIESHGQNLAEINVKLLKNLEELTLRLIEKDKQIQQQKSQLSTQQTDIDHIKSQLNLLLNPVK